MADPLSTLCTVGTLSLGLRYGLGGVERWLRGAVRNQAWFRRISGLHNSLGCNMQDEALMSQAAVLWHVASIAAATPALILGQRTRLALTLASWGTWGEVVYEVSELLKMAGRRAPYDTMPLLYQAIAGLHHMCAPAFAYVAWTIDDYRPKWWVPMAVSGTVLMGGSAVQYLFNKSTRGGRRGMVALYLGGGAVVLWLRLYCNRLLREEINTTDDRLRRRGRIMQWLYVWMNAFNAVSMAFVLDKARRLA